MTFSRIASWKSWLRISPQQNIENIPTRDDSESAESTPKAEKEFTALIQKFDELLEARSKLETNFQPVKIPKIPKISHLTITALPSAIITALKPEVLPRAIDIPLAELSILGEPFDLTIRNTAHSLLAYNAVKWSAELGILQFKRFIYEPSSAEKSENSQSQKKDPTRSKKIEELAISTIQNIWKTPTVRLAAVTTAALVSGLFLIETGAAYYGLENLYSSGLLTPIALGAATDLTLDAGKTAVSRCLNKRIDAIKNAVTASARNKFEKVKRIARGALESNWTWCITALSGVMVAPAIWTHSPDAALVVITGSVAAATRFAFTS